MPRPLVIVTGASSGIGKAVAIAFGREDHPLLLLSRRITPLPELPSDRVVYAQVDVTDYGALDDAVRNAEARYGTTGCLVNNAGVADGRAFTEVDPESYSREIDVNLKGVLNGTKAVLQGMLAQRAGTIINISSISDRKIGPAAVAYAASKHGVRALTESLRQSVAKEGIRFINIAPGYVRTNIHARMGISFAQYQERLGHPDFMTAEQLAEIILFCWKQPPTICIRDLVVAPTNSTV